MRRTTGAAGACAALWLSSACPADRAPAAAAKVAEKQADEKRAGDEEAAQRKAAREAEKRAEEEAARVLAARIEELTVLPPDMPKKLALDKACAGMLAAYDGFMLRVLTGDQKTKWETGGNEMQLAVFRKECLKRTAETAACQAHALSQAPPELEPQLSDLMRRCAEKHGASTESGRPPSHSR
jgi:hypothetical protein